MDGMVGLTAADKFALCDSRATNPPPTTNQGEEAPKTSARVADAGDQQAAHLFDTNKALPALT